VKIIDYLISMSNLSHIIIVILYPTKN
jgi:hypothetical protein